MNYLPRCEQSTEKSQEISPESRARNNWAITVSRHILKMEVWFSKPKRVLYAGLLDRSSDLLWRARANVRWLAKEEHEWLTSLSFLRSLEGDFTVSSLECKSNSWYIVHISQIPWTGNRVRKAKCGSKRVNEGMRWSVSKGRNNKETAKREKDINFRIRSKNVLTQCKGQNSVEWESCIG